MKIIGFVNQKGGVGKSTCVALFATLLQKKNEKVAVIDLDHQRSLETKRVREGSDVFPLIGANSENLQTTIELLKAQNVEYLVIDVPGNLLQKGVYQSYMVMDYMFVVSSLSILDMQSTLNFIEQLEDVRQSRKKVGYDTQMYLLLNKVDKNGKEYRNLLENLKDKLPIPMVEKIIPEHITIKRGISTTDTTRDAVANIVMEECFNKIQ